jgi:hypothetical protein
MAVGKARDPRSPPLHRIALRALAEEFLGLKYDPEVTFPREGEAVLAHFLKRDEHDHDIYRIVNALQALEVTFERRSGEPPIALQAGSLGNPGDRSEDGLAELTQRLIRNRFVVTTGFLGNYEPEHARVVLFDAAIEAAATRLAISRRSLATITLLHETIHALTHVGRDLDRRMWSEFALPPAASPLFEPSRFHAAIAQYFAYRFLLHLGDRALLDGFETLTDNQPPAYQEWRRMKDIPIEEVRGWLLRVRRGVAGASFRAPSSA